MHGDTPQGRHPLDPAARLAARLLLAAILALAAALPHGARAGGAGPAAERMAADLSAPVAAYRTYVLAQADAFLGGTVRLADAIKAGRLAEAQALYAPARQPYERIEPVAQMVPELARSMDMRADAFELKDRDPAFIGFHRIERGLFLDRSTTGLNPIAERLVADAAELRERITDLAIPPVRMVGGAASLIEEIAATKISGEEERYSRTDLFDLTGNLEGARTIFGLVRPHLAARDPAFVDRTERAFSRIEAQLARHRTPEGGYVSFDRLTDRDRNALKGPVTVLAEELATLRGRLGLD
ncbi:iron uptake system protein EfeO [Methylobacterium durans]|uniref:iron uptake system protein EfeO n=1 Tax=Methylobacterium durans TaxID=2202825 RepID=UPI002AFE1923|nr:iron uptake system protein EfeO [Methylobacterium durans]MEA1833082.1 iron uptake system protein EfeO [Methylobacterium durans]